MRRAPGIVAILIFISVLLLIDFYVFQGLRTLTSGLENKTRKIISWVYWGINFFLLLWLIWMFLFLFLNSTGGIPKSFSIFFGIWTLFFIPKLVFATFLIGEDVFRLLRGVFALGNNAISNGDEMAFSSSRRKFISAVAAGVATIPFLGILHGLTLGKFNYRVIRQTVFFPDLPKTFDGFTITQLSDIHVGSFDSEKDREEVKNAIDLANDQKSDLFVFTGDLVNNKASEMDPWTNIFKGLHSPYGQYSILGNHDYGDYVSWPSDKAKAENMEELYSIHKKIGFNLLRNTSVEIEKNGESLSLIGVENWGKGEFKKVGDLDLAMKNVPDESFKILLSHDPSHFDKIVSCYKSHVHLTLSGHTHGAQFGVEIPWLKWSPIQYRYPHWAGLYSVNGRSLYVNRGFGFLAFPARVGIWPEITVITLKRGSSVA